MSDKEFPSSARSDKEKFTKQGAERRRRLLPKHLDEFPWLAVSRVAGKEGVFCVPCVLFASATVGVGGRSEGRGQLPGKLVTKPLDKFDNLTGKDGDLVRHQATDYHKHSFTAMEEFKKVIMQRIQPDIATQLSECHRKEVEENRAFLSPIVDTILTCARQNIPLRGHKGEAGCVSSDGVEPEENDGNFRALLMLDLCSL
jgi:hypothetical protein